MIVSASGIILRTRPLTETSLIVHWLTPAFGRIATVAKGARRPKSPFAGKLDLFYEADLSFSRSRRSELHTLREVKLLETRAALRSDLGWLRQAAYAAALIEQTTETDTPLAGVHDLTRAFLNALPAHPAQPQNLFAFELKLLDELGQLPDLAKAQITAGTKFVARALIGAGDWDAVLRIKPSAAQVNELRQFLHGFLIYHLGRIPKGRAAAISGAV
ncbi:MAG TPA: DNA repair protein RecO [Verrucomicrobiota bacterium]|nr:DNA repair protein RecO [Verrucomicrobiota bacterium]